MAYDERYVHDDGDDGGGADHGVDVDRCATLPPLVDPQQPNPLVRLSIVHCHQPLRQPHHRCYCYLPRCSRFYSPMWVARVMWPQLEVLMVMHQLVAVR